LLCRRKIIFCICTPVFGFAFTLPTLTLNSHYMAANNFVYISLFYKIQNGNPCYESAANKTVICGKHFISFTVNIFDHQTPPC
jgi:hypothetical protein